MPEGRARSWLTEKTVGLFEADSVLIPTYLYEELLLDFRIVPVCQGPIALEDSFARTRRLMVKQANADWPIARMFRADPG